MWFAHLILRSMRNLMVCFIHFVTKPNPVIRYARPYIRYSIMKSGMICIVYWSTTRPSVVYFPMSVQMLSVWLKNTVHVVFCICQNDCVVITCCLQFIACIEHHYSNVSLDVQLLLECNVLVDWQFEFNGLVENSTSML